MLASIDTRVEDIQKELTGLLPPDAILVGHSITNDLKAMKVATTGIHFILLFSSITRLDFHFVLFIESAFPQSFKFFIKNRSLFPIPLLLHLLYFCPTLLVF